MKKIKSQNTVIPRDGNIFKCSTGELNLSTRVKEDRTKYSRKEKHKAKHY